MKKKIVFVIESLHLGGAEKSLVTLLNLLDYSKLDVDLILFNKDGFFNALLPKQVSVINENYPKLSLVERLSFAVKRKRNKTRHPAQLLWSLIKNKFRTHEKTYDIAIAYNQGFATYFTEKYINADKKLAWINTDYPKAGYYLPIDYPIYKKYNHVVCVSEESKITFTRALEMIKEKLDVVMVKDITDASIISKQAEEIPQYQFDDNKINILTVARLSKPKALHLTIEACKILKAKHATINWYIVGEGSERENLEALIKANQLESNMHLLGAFPNPYPYMKACDIYVQTSLFEGLGLTLIEASYLNKPIVTTNFPTAFSIINDGETGLIAEMTAESIAEKIDRLILDKTLQERLISNLEKQENTDKEKSLAQIEKLFSE